MSVDPILVIEALLLLLLANGTPVVATRLLGDRWSRPLDGGLTLGDGRRLLGASKTWRGVVSAVAVVTPAAVIMGLSVAAGAGFALASLTGDAASSFVKRRLGIESSGRAVGLDQIPEALLPMLVCYGALGAGVLDVVVVVTVFTVGQAVISPLMYRLGIRHRPY